MGRNHIVGVCVLLFGASLWAQQQAGIKVVESASETGEAVKATGVGMDKRQFTTDSFEIASPPSPCSAVTSDGGAPKSYIALFTSPCNIESSLIFENTNRLGTTVNLRDGLFVNATRLGGLGIGIGGCSNPAMGSVYFGPNNTCTGYAIASDGTNTYINAISTSGAVVLENNGTVVADFAEISGKANFHEAINVENDSHVTGFLVDTAGNLTDNGAATFNGSVFTVLNGAVFNGGLTVSNNAIFGGEATIDGPATFNSGIVVPTGDVFVSGNVTVSGTLNVSGTKNFKIDDPLDPANKYMYHASVESSEIMNMYTGNIFTDDRGDATVQLPAWFEVLNRDFRYQLTVIGQFAQAIVANKIANHNFRIKTDKPNVEVSWQITGVRQDAYAKAHPLVVEEEKPAAERGYYLRPELFGQPESKGVSYAQ